VAKTRTKMSIIHAADYAPTYSGNFIASLRAAAQECRAHGYRIVWVFPDVVRDFAWFQALSMESDASAYTLSRAASCLTNAKTLARIAAAENAALIHTHFSFFDLSARLAQALSALKFRRIRLVWHVHSAFTDTSWRRRVKDFMKLGVLGRSCHVVPVSSVLGESVAERGCPRKRIHVIDNGVDVERATARQRTREDTRAEWRIPNQALVLLGFGWTPIRKGVDTMLEALAILLQDGMDVVLIVAGTEELHKFIEGWPDRDCCSRVRVIPPAERVSELFAASDIFLAPSRAEGWCYSLAEAMLNGVPVAAAKIAALAYADDWPGVHFCQVGSSDSLAASIRQIVGLSETERQRQGELAKKFVDHRHSVRQWGRQVWNLYDQILNSRQLPSSSAPSPLEESVY
jgi:glycosyltransferase involved in cell wall biosynthesis